MSYKSDRKFRLWIYAVSHSMLLIRSNKRVDESGDTLPDAYTIDIEFWGVAYIQIPHRLTGLSIEVRESRLFTEILPKEQMEREGLKVFEITSEGKKNYIVAAGYTVGKSAMDYDENRLLDLKLKYDEILVSG